MDLFRGEGNDEASPRGKCMKELGSLAEKKWLRTMEEKWRKTKEIGDNYMLFEDTFQF